MLIALCFLWSGIPTLSMSGKSSYRKVGMAQVSILIVREGATDARFVDVDQETKIVELLEEDDGRHVFLPDADDPLDVELTLVKAGVADGGEITVARNKKVSVIVRYAGLPPRTDERPPSQRLNKVLQWALGPHGFDIPKSQRPSFELADSNTGAALDLDDTIVQHLKAGGDTVTFDLRKIDAPQGDR
jgi:hypothetical protein